MSGGLQRELHALAGSDPGERVLSLYARTDPRESANTNHVPGWLIAARNQLRRVQAAAERDEDRERRQALRELANRAQKQPLEALAPYERGALHRAIPHAITISSNGA